MTGNIIYIHIETLMLLNMPKNLEICIIEVVNYRKIDVETESKNKKPGGLVKVGWTRNK